jgi:hypothetical protein
VQELVIAIFVNGSSWKPWHSVHLLGIQFVFVKVFIYLLQIGEQGIFFKLKIYVPFGEPGFG